MEIIIVCHTEFGQVINNQVVADKKAGAGADKGAKNLARVADKHGAKVTFAVMPETAKYFPTDISHEIGVHIHPGWQEFQVGGHKFFVGDAYLREHCNQTSNSTVLRDYSYQEQSEMIKAGIDHLYDVFDVEPRVFVAGRWSVNNDTVKALLKADISHDCSAQPHRKHAHFDWSRLPRICMPYNPKASDYQCEGSLPLLVVPISQMLFFGNVNPEAAPAVGVPWMKASFLEYYKQKAPLYHICLHSPCMTEPYFVSIMDELLKYVSLHNVEFKFASEIQKREGPNLGTRITPYLTRVNRSVLRTLLSQPS